MRVRHALFAVAGSIVAATLGACSGAAERLEPIAPTSPLSTTTTTSAQASATSTTSVATSVATSTSVATTTTTTTTMALDPLQGLALEVVAEGLDRPVFVTAPVGDPRVFIVERTARILVYDPLQGLRPEPFIDLRDRVSSVGIEQGLLGLAFHPEYSANGRFFVYYTDKNDDSVMSEFSADPGSDTADPESERVVLTLDQPTDRHNAGMLQFGPDGTLYLSFGEGGAEQRNAQDPTNWFGTIVRLDVDGARPYAIPADNPFAGGGGAPEVWAYGFRNPWRYSIDPVDGLMYVGDVGHGDWEEIDIVPLDGAPYNFGWPNVEGAHCFFESGCDPSDYVLPALEYDHSGGDCSVTGGFVYRGEAIPELAGHYFYADWCGRWVRSFRYRDGAVTDETDWTEDLGDVGQVNSFGTDAAGELYIATWDGRVAKIVPER